MEARDGGGGRGVGIYGDRVSVWEDEKVLEMMVVTVAQPLRCS